MTRTSSGGRGRRPSYTNFQLALVSIALGLAIWLIAKRDEVDTDNIEVLVEFGDVPPHLEVKSDPERVSVTMQFPRGLRTEVAPSNFAVVLDAADLNPARFAGTREQGVEPYALRSGDLEPLDPRLATGQFNVLRFQPGTIQVKARYHGRMVAVKPRLGGTPAPGHIIDAEQTVPRPREVFLAGAPERIAMLPLGPGGKPEIETEEIDIQGLERGRNVLADLNVPDGLQVIGEGQVVEVSLGIRPVRTTRTITDVPVDLVVLASNVAGVVVTPPRVAVEVEGPKTQLDLFDADSFTIRTGKEENVQEIADREYRDVLLDVDVRRDIPGALDGDFVIRRVVPDRVTIRFLPVERAPDEAGAAGGGAATPGTAESDPAPATDASGAATTTSEGGAGADADLP
jgi:hypothetical protein